MSEILTAEHWAPQVPAGRAGAARITSVSAALGRGDELWAWAADDLLNWRIKTRSGFRVSTEGTVAEGQRPTITAGVLGMRIEEPVEVVEVIESPDRVGFLYRTRPGHPVEGEEAFILTREGEDVFLRIRSVSGPAAQQPWRMIYPLLRVAQRVAHCRYLRAL